MTVGISIISYNSKDILEKLLKSLLSQKHKNHTEIWIVDNASPDDSVKMLEKNFGKKIHLIKNPSNDGFAAGQNLALKKMNNDYALILNPDTQLPAGAVDKMVDFMKMHPECGIASCRITDYNGKLSPNGGDLPRGLALLSWLFNLESFYKHIPNFHRADESYYKQVSEVGWVGGTFMMVSKQVIDKVGYLNEDYFMYFEDVEYCIKAREKGFKIMINPAVTIKHVSGGSHAVSPQLRQWSGEIRGLLYYYEKNYGALPTIFLKVLVYLSVILRMLAFFALGKFDVARTYVKVLGGV